jgi:cardiolipin synthase
MPVLPELLPGNCLRLLLSGAQFFPALEADIDAAQKLIHIETYIYVDDAAGRRIANALMRAVARGVHVRLIADGFGCKRYFTVLREELLAAGVEVLLYRPDLTSWDLRRSRLRRLHRKIAVIDGRVGFVGGINIIDDMNTPNHTPPRRDYAVRIMGPVLQSLAAEAESLWRIVAWANFRQRWIHAPQAGSVHALQCGHQHAALVVRDNLLHREDIENAYLAAIQAARVEIILACPYFFPGQRFRQALKDAAGRGVRVIVLLQARVEFALLHYASRALYGALLDAGVEIHEYSKSFFHAKVAVIDSRWATVGSSNIDPFSLLVAREANIVVRDEGFALELRASLLAHLSEGAHPVEPHRWRRNPWRLRVRIWMAYGITRFLIGWFGYADRQ